jgi:hypothetical protein
MFDFRPLACLLIRPEVVPVLRNSDPKRVCTSIIERQNLTIRTRMRRLIPLTIGFSKKWENRWAAFCLHFAYLFLPHSSLDALRPRCRHAGTTDRVWDIADLLS